MWSAVLPLVRFHTGHFAPTATFESPANMTTARVPALSPPRALTTPAVAPATPSITKTMASTRVHRAFSTMYQRSLVAGDPNADARQLRGSPRMRSAMIVRWISLVPPAIDAAFDHSHCRVHEPRSGA